jgi:hypothetical protein
LIKLLSIFSLVLLTSPASAITWKEFWEPFNDRGYYSYPVRRYSLCRREVYREQYIPGDRWNPGYVRRWIEVREELC